MPEITYLPRNYQRKENEQLTSKLSKGFEWVSVAQEQVRQSILDDTMNLWEITPVVVSVLERMKPNGRELAAIERKMESDRKRKKRFKIGTVALSTAATIACFFLSGGAATALQLAARAGAVTVATAGGIVMGVDELANALETERMVYASMYGKEDGAFTDEDIVSAKNGTRATAFYFALDIFGAFEAVQAWKMLAKYNALIPPVQDGIASLKNGKKVLETLSPEQLSGLSQLPSNDPIYPLLDTMKNGRINGVSVDEYIAIRQRANQGVINQLNNREVLDVLNFRKPSESIFTGDLRGEKITLKEVSVEEITYIKKERTELILLRKEFDTNIRKQFLINLVEQKGDDFFRKAGFSETDILKLKNGRLPDGWQVHHKLALDDGGTNDYDNLLLIQNEPYHKVITNYQNHKAKNLTPGQSKKVDWPIPLGSVYPKSH